MALKIPTFDETVLFLRSLGRALLSTRDWSPLGTGAKWATWVGGAVTDLHAHLRGIWDDVLPDRAQEATGGLQRHANVHKVTRKPATGARKASALRVYGSPGAGVSVGDVLESTAGLRFEITEADTIPGGGTYVDVDIAAIDTGSQTRLPKGTVLTFSNPPASIEEQAELVLDLDEDGDDQETVGQWRDRLLKKIGDPPLGGADADYEQWALELTGIATAYVYPLRRGLGSIDVAALHAGRGTARLLSAGEITELQDYLDDRAPVHTTGGALRVLTVDDTSADVEVLVQPNGEPEFEFDWDDTVAPTAHAATPWDAPSRTLQFTAPRPDSMKPGGRITIKPALGGGTGEQYVIESLSGSDAVVLETAPVPAPAAGDSIYAGGPLVDEVRDAILEHFDELGTSNTDAAPYGPWEANLRPANLYRIAQGTDGVRRSTVVEPAAAVEPADNAYPDDATVYVLVPGRVLVRKG